LAHFIREVLPEMKVHASTQMTINNSYGIESVTENSWVFPESCLPWKLPRHEMKKIIRETNLEVEVFGTGPYGSVTHGQCLMSSYIGR
jgi:putative protease